MSPLWRLGERSKSWLMPTGFVHTAVAKDRVRSRPPDTPQNKQEAAAGHVLDFDVSAFRRNDQNFS